MVDSVVAPLAGAWIEIVFRGKSNVSRRVAPLAGAWIEMSAMPGLMMTMIVAPLAGAWIEMRYAGFCRCRACRSLPSRERGLKFYYQFAWRPRIKSLPSRERGLKFKGKLIEREKGSRSPRGSVD